jgi:pimeloyl-ACP methyl ester carboxylesterase
MPLFRKLGFAVVATEMPGAGENTLRYGPDSWRMVSDLLTELAPRADVARTSAIAFSFSGHMALRAAGQDPRITGVITAGAPVHDFFTDRAWQERIPAITRDTLARMTGTKPSELADSLPGWALTDEQLAAVTVPVAYLASRRDEIIPPTEAPRLRERLSRLQLVENNDTHGSPRHVVESQLWTLASLLRITGQGGGRRVVVAGLSRAARLAGRLRPTRG